MNIYVADENINVLAVVDSYKSIIWTNRYFKAGDFELYVPYTETNKKLFKQDYIVWRDKDVTSTLIERPKIIEKIEVVENASESYLLITGRDVTSVFDRRVIYPTEVLKDTLENCIMQLIDDCIISPTEENRKIATFDTKKNGIIIDDVDTQITGDGLLDYIEDISNDYKIGFRTDIDVENKKFLFQIYKGADRTDYDNNPVIFSKTIDNLIKIDYVNDKESYKTMAIVGGAGEGSARKVVRLNDDLTGMERRELWVDAKDLQQTDSSGTAISDEDYLKQLEQRGSEKLSDNSLDITNGCEIEPNTNYVFNEDYFVGDIVIVDGFEKINERIVETEESITASGEKVELSFEEIEEDD